MQRALSDGYVIRKLPLKFGAFEVIGALGLALEFRRVFCRASL